MVSSNAKPLLMSLLSAIVSNNLVGGLQALDIGGLNLGMLSGRAVILLISTPNISAQSTGTQCHHNLYSVLIIYTASDRAHQSLNRGPVWLLIIMKTFVYSNLSLSHYFSVTGALKGDNITSITRND
jgi:hypothetical protein